MIERAVIILAGGQAERFQMKLEPWKDKALAMLSGKPLIVHIIERISDVTEEIVVCVNNQARKAQVSEVLRNYAIRDVEICVDEKSPHVAGPLVAIATGLKSTSADYCLTVPCDVPFVMPKIVDYLFSAVKGSHVAVPIWPDGGLESLIMACDRTKAGMIAQTLLKLRRRRPDDIIRGVSKALFVSTIGDLRKLDPEFKSFININLRKDLVILPKRVAKKGPIKENLRLNLGSPTRVELKQLIAAARCNDKREFEEALNRFSSCSTRLETEGLNFWAGASLENEGEILFNLSEQAKNAELKKGYGIKGEAAFLKAARTYGFEAEKYDKNHIGFLARHARADQSYCRSRSQSIL